MLFAVATIAVVVAFVSYRDNLSVKLGAFMGAAARDIAMDGGNSPLPARPIVPGVLRPERDQQGSH